MNCSSKVAFSINLFHSQILILKCEKMMKKQITNCYGNEIVYKYEMWNQTLFS